MGGFGAALWTVDPEPAIDPCAREPWPLELSATPGKVAAMRSAVSLIQLMDAGLLEPDQALTGTRDGRTYRAKLQPDGTLTVAGYGAFRSPSLAANAISGGNTNGWVFWHVRGGRSLADVRSDYAA